MSVDVAAAEQAPPLSAARITTIMALVQLLITSDFSIISVALPSIGAGLAIDPSRLAWVISANAITFGGFMIVGGRLTDIFGHRRMLLAGLAAFMAGSLLSAVAQTLWMLIGSRAVQGLGAAVIAPASFSLIAAFLLDERQRQRALGVFGVTQGASVIVGLVVGGAVTTMLGWRSAFFVTLPFALVSALLAALTLPSSAPRRQRLDIGGGAMMAIATGLLLHGVTGLGRDGINAAAILTLIAAAACYALFVWIEARHPNPLLPLALFRTGDLSAVCAALALLIGGVGSLFVLAGLFMQRGLGLSAAQSGAGMIPIALATMLAGQCAPWLMRRLPLRRIGLIGMAVQLAGLALLAHGTRSGSYWLSVAPFGFLATVGSASAFVALMALGSEGLHADRQGTASAMLFTAQQLGLPICVAVSLAVAGSTASYATAFMAAAGLVLGGAAILAIAVRGAQLPA